ncbi:M28 family peptidase [Streptomyces specialis]|uniref:M28 family peptidase n=1 Tax=Streptomyces specialis TaxID=498367 RepID=UPI000A87493D|nr:M28 family peptidase [Streptomyces specialis]
MTHPLARRFARRLRRGAPAALAVAAVTAPLLLAAPVTSPAAGADSGGPADALAEAVTGEGALRHLAALQRIADASDGTRAAGTPGHERSARYAGTLLAAAGYDVTYQRFAFPYREPLTERLTRLTPEERDIPVRVMTYSPATPPGGLTAALTPAGTGCAAADFGPGPLTGRIALIERGTCTFAEKQANAAEAGAAGALIRNNVPGELSGTLGGPEHAAIPTGGISRADGEELLAALTADEEVTVRLELAELAEERTTTNVIAETPGGDPSRVVMAGAHLDSVPGGPGLNDNGSGAAGILETALRLAATAPADGPPHRVRFALWSAEEFGLLGSEHYVANLPADARDAVALYLNFDMIASPNYGLFVYEGSEPVRRDITAFLEGRGLSPGHAPLDGRSDYGPFVAAGIPAGGVFTGAEGVKSEAEASLWGGTAGAPYDACYHAACDDLRNISATALDIGAKVIAHAVGRYAWRLPEPEPRPGPRPEPPPAHRPVTGRAR